MRTMMATIVSAAALTLVGAGTAAAGIPPSAGGEPAPIAGSTGSTDMFLGSSLADHGQAILFRLLMTGTAGYNDPCAITPNCAG